MPTLDDPSIPAPEHGLDVCHTAMVANRALAHHQRAAKAAWERVEAADMIVAKAKQQGREARCVAQAARAASARAVASFE